ncbi:hypothetical protein KUTeg_021056 [Tegillarca granosa]|uniref:CUB domain-containing protein n=1 Tax=Tegillarca granosa TaxID=220873 RepID=A0ABQ9EC45_TEGGR|nr:hypothetical protein KUTeg_021056 [Tegillarca granosa]
MTNKMTFSRRTVFVILSLLFNSILLCTADDDDDVTLTVDGSACNGTKNLDDAKYVLHWNGENFSPSCSFKFKPSDENHKVCLKVKHMDINDCQVSVKFYFYKSAPGSPSEIFTCSNTDDETHCGELNENANITFTSIYSLGSITPYSFQSSEVEIRIYDEYTMPVYLVLIIVFVVLAIVGIITAVIIVIIVKMNKRNKIQGKVINNGRSIMTGYNPYQRQQQGQPLQQHTLQTQVYPRQPPAQHPHPVFSFAQQPQPHNRLPPLNQPPPYPSSENTGPTQIPSSSQFSDEQLYGNQVQPSAPPPAYSPAMTDGLSQQPAQEKY